MGFYVEAEPEVKIYVEDINPSGSPTILFVHGWPGDHTLFEYQYNQLPKLGYRCVGVDTRGFGKSDRPWEGYDYNRLSDDLRAVIDALQLHDIVLAGHSTGGAIVTRYMARHRGHRIAKLALFAAAVPSLIQRPYFPYGLTEESILEIIHETYTNRPNMLTKFGDMIFRGYVTPSLSDWIFQLGLRASSWATAAVSETWIKEELFEDMRLIQVPTLILHGLNDQVCLFPLAVAQRDAIRNSRLVPFECCGHFLFYDQLDRFQQELIRFLEE